VFLSLTSATVSNDPWRRSRRALLVGGVGLLLSYVRVSVLLAVRSE
jgi:hypothetical protein